MQPESGTFFASSQFNADFAPIKASMPLPSSYWCSAKNPTRPIRLWVQFKEPKRIVKIKFKEKYKMTGEDGYEVNEIGE